VAGHNQPQAQLDDTILSRGDDTLLSRAAWVDGIGALVKTATVLPGNARRGQPTVHGHATLFSDTDGSPVAEVDFELLTKWKTAATSLLACRTLAPPNVNRILIVGAGAVAASMIEAYRALFPHATIGVFNRTPARAERLAAKHPGTHVERNLEEAAFEADVICTATLSREPVVFGTWLRPGQHLDLIGAFRPDMREVDSAALRRSEVYVDAFETALVGTGELAIPLAHGDLAREDIRGDFYDLAAGRWQRTQDSAITICKNAGGAHLDAMTAAYMLSKAAA
jgi:ornithine cyclodeaminase